jgi:hypothetical protein
MPRASLVVLTGVSGRVAGAKESRTAPYVAERLA